MSYTTPLTAVSNSPFTAAQYNASDRDNMLVTPAGLTTAAGQMYVSTAANAGAMRTPTFASTTGAGTTTSIGTYGDLTGTTVGPLVVVSTGVAVIYGFAANISNATGGGGGQMAIAITGATPTIAADDSRDIYFRHTTAAFSTRLGQVQFQPGLTAGSNTLTAKYTTPTGGTATFFDRHLFAIPL